MSENEKLVERLRESADWPEVRPISASELREAAAALTAAEARIKMLSEALARQSDNMAFLLNRVELNDSWRDKLDRELTEDRQALTGASDAG